MPHYSTRPFSALETFNPTIFKKFFELISSLFSKPLQFEILESII
jgi:hypothetical protein